MPRKQLRYNTGCRNFGGEKEHFNSDYARKNGIMIGGYSKIVEID